MRSSVAARSEQEQRNVLEPPLPGMIGAVPKGQRRVKTDEAWLWMLPEIRLALDRVMSRKEAAKTIGMDEGQLSRALNGDGNLLVAHLGAWGERFWIALTDEMRAKFKLDDPQARIERAAELVTRGLALLVAETKR